MGALPRVSLVPRGTEKLYTAQAFSHHSFSTSFWIAPILDWPKCVLLGLVCFCVAGCGSWVPLYIWTQPRPLREGRDGEGVGQAAHALDELGARPLVPVPTTPITKALKGHNTRVLCHKLTGRAGEGRGWQQTFSNFRARGAHVFHLIKSTARVKKRRTGARN